MVLIPSLQPIVVIELLEDQRVNVYLRSDQKSNRGKILLRIEGVRVLGNVRAIVAAIDATCELAAYDSALFGRIVDRWKAIGLRVVDAQTSRTDE